VPKDREHTALLIVLDRVRWQLEVLDAVLTGWPERDERIKRRSS
jgi:hypothetical protein